MGLTKYLKIKAGKRAYNKLLEHGLSSDIVKVFSAAAGGPKWIILYELDKYLMEHFFKNKDHKIHFIGGSIGAWRSMCYLSDDPLGSIKKLKEGYLNQRYALPFTKEEVSETCHNIILDALGENGINSILNHPHRILNISTSAASFDSVGKGDGSLKLRFAWIAFLNLLHRRSMNINLSRHLFTTATDFNLINEDGIDTKIIPLNDQNSIPALRASGAIPVSMLPIVIDGKEHWDGGIVDYHLDLSYNDLQGIVLYPHFLPFIRPGWFDKWTRLRYSKHHQDTLLLYPSMEFIELLPDKKLTSLQDFYTYKHDQDSRIKKWYQAADLGKKLVEDFEKLLDPSVLEINLEQF